MFNRHLAYIDKNTINIDNLYQRERTPDRENHIVKEFNEDQFQNLLVAERDDGTFWAIDGQARLRAAKRLEFLTLLPCDVRISEGPIWEAALFRAVNGDVTKIKPRDIFKARIAEEDPEALELNELIKNIDIGGTIGVLQDTFHTKKEAFKRMWPIIVELYKDSGLMMNSYLIRGFIRLEHMLSGVSLTDFRNYILHIGIKEFDKLEKSTTAESSNSAKNIALAIKTKVFGNVAPNQQS